MTRFNKKELEAIAEIMHDYVKEGYPSPLYASIEQKAEQNIKEIEAMEKKFINSISGR